MGDGPQGQGPKMLALARVLLQWWGAQTLWAVTLAPWPLLQLPPLTHLATSESPCHSAPQLGDPSSRVQQDSLAPTVNRTRNTGSCSRPSRLTKHLPTALRGSPAPSSSQFPLPSSFLVCLILGIP